jgi:hypothetical protein
MAHRPTAQLATPCSFLVDRLFVLGAYLRRGQTGFHHCKWLLSLHTSHWESHVQVQGAFRRWWLNQATTPRHVAKAAAPFHFPLVTLPYGLDFQCLHHLFFLTEPLCIHHIHQAQHPGRSWTSCREHRRFRENVHQQLLQLQRAAGRSTVCTASPRLSDADF